MLHLSIAERYRPARFLDGREAMIVYYVYDPAHGRRVRVKEKVNHIREGRARWVAQRIRELNGKLALGWNPFLERIAPKAATTLGQAIDDFLRHKERDALSADSLRSYRSQCDLLRAWLQHKGLLDLATGELGEEHTIAFMDHRWASGGISARTFKNNRNFFVTLGTWWVDHKYARSNAFKAVKLKRHEARTKNRRPLTEAERAAIRQHLQNHHPRFLTFCLFLFHCGLRPKEAFLLRPRHIDLQRACVRVEADMAKTNVGRVAAIPQVFMPMVQALGLDRQHPDHYVFSTHFEAGAVRKDSRYSGKAWHRLRTELRLPAEVKNYSLRDTGILQLARDQVSRIDSQNHFGHSSSDMHDVYGRQALESGSDEVRRKASAF